MTNADVRVIEYRGVDCPAIAELERAADAEGHRFVARTRHEWLDGTNRFDGVGETFFVALAGNRVVAMCGVNIDPYVNSTRVGRLRHMYTHPDYRRQGVAEALVRTCMRHGSRSFEKVRLRTDNPAADALYQSLGFEQVDEADATHTWRPDKSSAVVPGCR